MPYSWLAFCTAIPDKPFPISGGQKVRGFPKAQKYAFFNHPLLHPFARSESGCGFHKARSAQRRHRECHLTSRAFSPQHGRHSVSPFHNLANVLKCYIVSPLEHLPCIQYKHRDIIASSSSSRGA